MILVLYLDLISIYTIVSLENLIIYKMINNWYTIIKNKVQQLIFIGYRSLKYHQNLQ